MSSKQSTFRLCSDASPPWCALLTPQGIKRCHTRSHPSGPVTGDWKIELWLYFLEFWIVLDLVAAEEGGHFHVPLVSALDALGKRCKWRQTMSNLNGNTGFITHTPLHIYVVYSAASSCFLSLLVLLSPTWALYVRLKCMYVCIYTDVGYTYLCTSTYTDLRGTCEAYSSLQFVVQIQIGNEIFIKWCPAAINFLFIVSDGELRQPWHRDMHRKLNVHSVRANARRKRH